MTIGKRDLEKIYRERKTELAALEAKCMGGSGTKEDYIALAKFKKKMK